MHILIPLTVHMKIKSRSFPSKARVNFSKISAPGWKCSARMQAPKKLLSHKHISEEKLTVPGVGYSCDEISLLSNFNSFVENNTHSTWNQHWTHSLRPTHLTAVQARERGRLKISARLKVQKNRAQNTIKKIQRKNNYVYSAFHTRGTKIDDCHMGMSTLAGCHTAVTYMRSSRIRASMWLMRRAGRWLELGARTSSEPESAAASTWPA